jgi:hypothetical protein
MNKYWFKPKTYGYGFYPISREGRVSTISLVWVLLLIAYVNWFFDLNMGDEMAIWASINFLFNVIVISMLFTLLFKNKVKWWLQWKWGNKNNNK